MNTDEGFNELYCLIKDNKNIDDDNKKKILKEIAIMKYNHRRDKIQRILDEFIVAYENEDYKAMDKMMFESPAGDGWGLDNMTIRYRDLKDIFSVINELKDEYNDINGITKEAE